MIHLIGLSRVTEDSTLAARALSVREQEDTHSYFASGHKVALVSLGF